MKPTEDQMRELQEAYNESILVMLKKKRTCGPNCKLCQKAPLKPAK